MTTSHSVVRRIVQVIDRPDWVLATIARETAAMCAEVGWTVTTVASHDFYTDPLRTSRQLAAADVVHWMSPQLWFSFGGLWSRAAHVCSIHHVLEGDRISPDRFRGAAIVTGSLLTMEALRTRGFERVAVAHYGVDTRTFAPGDRSTARRSLHLPVDVPIVGWFAKESSNRDDRKGTGHLVSSLQSLNQRRRVDVLLTGEGWADLSARLASVGVTVHRRPAERIEEMVARYAAIDCYLCTSAIEGGPVPVLEAMACARPVVATPVGHCPEVLADPSVGRLTGIGQPAITTELVANVLADHGGREAMGFAARSLVEAEWSWRQGQSKMLGVYDSAPPRRGSFGSVTSELKLWARAIRHRARRGSLGGDVDSHPQPPSAG